MKDSIICIIPTSQNPAIYASFGLTFTLLLNRGHEEDPGLSRDVGALKSIGSATYTVVLI